MISTSLLFFLSYLRYFGNLLESDPLVVDTGYASYLGNRSFPDTVAYLGIPYAEPPTGERRFRGPVPLNTTRVAEEAGGKVVDATKYPNFCIQGATSGSEPGGAGSEDCLKINIYVPSCAKKGDNLPVLFYIHGGGYVNGNPRNWPFDHWVHQSPNVVIVSVYYRLDAFGFLATPEFIDSGNGDLNAGFLDQIEALKWVKRNVASFGGDPTRVTINGESAGGGSVQHHLVAQEGEVLFSGAIAQSVYRTPAPTPEQQKPLFDFFVSATGCGEPGSDISTQLKCLRSVGTDNLARAQDLASSAFNGAYNMFRPVIDGKVIVGNPSKLISQGKFAQVPLIVGSTSNETLVGGEDLPAALRTTFPALTDQDIQDILEVAPETDFSSPVERFQTVTGESLIRCGREILGGAYANAPKSWTYRYNQPNPTLGIPAVTHAAENYMMFLGTNTGPNGTTTFNPLNPVEDAFAEELIAYWISFARAGDPNTYKLPRSPYWPQYTLPENGYIDKWSSWSGGRRQRVLSGGLSKRRLVLQQDPGNSTTASGSFVEQEPMNEGKRCDVVAAKAEREQN
ncbi:hypothetical protein V5O48_003900 [Marasmius crinis-equi]|uniref:Carboxylic ester hydrolase n=1 Tax=Marasmius crinis-equi TaxID=585013 RepID=A0ABR3FRL5_9AGAR